VRTGDGTPKLSQRAFSFQFVIEPAGHGRFVWWTRAPVSGRLSVQRRSSRGWRSVFGTLVRTHQALERGAPSRLRRGADGRGPFEDALANTNLALIVTAHPGVGHELIAERASAVLDLRGCFATHWLHTSHGCRRRRRGRSSRVLIACHSRWPTLLTPRHRLAPGGGVSVFGPGFACGKLGRGEGRTWAIPLSGAGCGAIARLMEMTRKSCSQRKAS